MSASGVGQVYVPRAPYPAPVRRLPMPATRPAAPQARAPLGGAVMTVTPGNMPIGAVMLAPLVSNGNQLRVTFALTSYQEGLPFHVASHEYVLSDWSARVVETGAFCTSAPDNLKGLRTNDDISSPKTAQAMDRLPRGLPTYVDETMSCDRPVTKGNTLLFVARVDIGDRSFRAIRLTSRPLRILDHR